MTDLVELADLAGLYRRFEWAERAACRGYPQEWWFPERGESTARALAVCAVCPVRDECRTHAYELREKSGIWGGETGRERREAFAKLNRGGRPRAPEVHGSVAGYRQHYRRGEKPCDECRQAAAVQRAESKAAVS